jgi:PAS domain S-box-containing protein
MARLPPSGQNGEVSARRDAEQDYRAMFEAMDEGCLLCEVVVDPSGEPVDVLHVDANPAAVRLLGQSYVGRKLSQIEPGFGQHRLEVWARVAVGGVPARFRAQATSTGRWLEVHAFRIGEPHERRVAVLLNDVTGRKRDEEALRENEERLRFVIENSPDSIFVQDAGLRYVWVATPAAPLERQEYIGRTDHDLMGREDAERLTQIKREVMRTGCATTVELPLVIKGRPLVFHATYQPWRDADGAAIGVAGYVRDITGRKRADEALRESEEHFRQLAENIPQLAWMTSADGWIFWYNRRWYDYTGTTLEQMQGWGWRSVHHPDHVGRVTHKIKQAFDTGEAWEDTFPLRGKDGKYRWFLSRAFPIQDGSGNIARWFGTNTDITELRETQEALRESEQHYRLLFETMTEGFALCEMIWSEGGKPVDFRYLQVNRAWVAHTGIPIEETVGRTAREVIRGAEPYWIETYARVVETGEPVVYENYASGLDRWFETFAFRHSARRFALLFRDVTERKRAEEALHLAVQRFETLANIMPQIVWSTRPDGYHDYFNDRWYEFTGMPRQGDQGWNWKDYLHPDDVQPTLAVWHRCLATGEPYEVQYRFRRAADGVYRWFIARALPIRDREGNISRWFGTCTEITDIIEAQQALRESEAKFRAFFENAAIGTVQLDLEGRVLQVNDRYCEITGYSREELLRMRLLDLAHPDELPSEREKLAVYLQGGIRFFESEKRYVRKDGTSVWVHATAALIRDVDGKPLRSAGVVQDITERKRAETALATAQEELKLHASRLEHTVAERTSRLRDTVAELEHFSYTITHDMRAPLRAMQAFGQILRDEYHRQLDDTAADYLRRIIDAAARMDNLITDSLSYAKAVQAELTLEPVDVGVLLRGIVESYPQFQYPRADIQVADPFPPVFANPAGLTQCFSNLLGNAVKFVAPGKLPRVYVWGEERGEVVRLWFEDNGVGIPPDQQERVFAMFQRLSKDYEGTGVGLALVRKVMEKMRGRVGVESGHAGGSRFWLEVRRVSAGA